MQRVLAATMLIGAMSLGSCASRSSYADKTRAHGPRTVPSTLAPDSSIYIAGFSTLTWSDIRAIERLARSLGVKQLITVITPNGPDRAEIYCETRPPSISGWGTSSPKEELGDGIAFTVVRKAGHWVALGRLRKSHRGIAYERPNQAMERTAGNLAFHF